MTDWKAISKALDTGIPDDQMERIAPVMEALERAFAPLIASIPAGTEMWVPEQAVTRTPE
jgi:hypothetical protein